MENLNDKISQLLNKAEWSDRDKLWMLEYLETSDNEQLRKLLEQQFEVETKRPVELDSDITERMLQNIHERIGEVKPRQQASLIKMWALRIGVASVVASLFFSTYSWFKKDPKIEVVKSHESKPAYKRPIEPGKDKAVLTLADGSTIVLDDKQNGALAEQGTTKVIKLNGKLVYNSANGNSKEILYNTITTPAGGQYQIELPDGSLVWLNSGSSLYFPTAFSPAIAATGS